MCFLYIFLALLVPFTAAVPLPSHLATTGSNASSILYSRDVPTVTFSYKLQSLPPYNKEVLAAYAQGHHEKLDDHALKRATHVKWEGTSRFQYHTGTPNHNNKIGGPFFKPLVVKYRHGILKSNLEGVEGKILHQYNILDADNRYKKATHANVFKGWHKLEASDTQERATFQYHSGSPGFRNRIGTPWDVFRDAKERSPPSASRLQVHD